LFPPSKNKNKIGSFKLTFFLAAQETNE